MGGGSAPIIMGGCVFVCFNSAGEGETMQERVMAFDANNRQAPVGAPVERL